MWFLFPLGIQVSKAVRNWDQDRPPPGNKTSRQAVIADRIQADGRLSTCPPRAFEKFVRHSSLGSTHREQLERSYLHPVKSSRALTGFWERDVRHESPVLEVSLSGLE